MPRAAKRHKGHKPESAATTLDELQSLGDRVAGWVGENPALILGVGLAILLTAAGWGILADRRDGAQSEAADDLARVQADFRVAMGGEVDDIEISEPANAETATQARQEFVVRFRELAESHGRTPAAALARLEAGNLQEDLGEASEARATWQVALESLDQDDPLRALTLQRIASSYEQAGQWLEAGETFELASDVGRYPLRYTALADAARCYAEAGEAERALASFARVEDEAPKFTVPVHIRTQLSELRAAGASPGVAPVSG